MLRDVQNGHKMEGCAIVTGQRPECAVTKDAPIIPLQGVCVIVTAQGNTFAPSKGVQNNHREEGFAVVMGQSLNSAVVKDVLIKYEEEGFAGSMVEN